MSEHNQRQFRLMLDQLTSYERRQIALDRLVANLEGLLEALEGVSASWKRSFRQQWAKLEDEFAYTRFKEASTFDDAASERLRTATSKLKLLVPEQIDDPAALG